MYRIATLAAGLCFSAVGAVAQSRALVTDLRGEAHLAGGAKVRFLSEMAPESRLVLGSDARVTLIYTASGTEFVLSGPGEYIVGAAELKALKGAAPARRDVTIRPDPVVVSRLANTATASVRMRSAAAPKPIARGTLLVYPQGTPIATLQPTFRWQSDSPDGGFGVVLVDAEGRPTWRGASKAMSARSGAKLAASTRYTWKLLRGEATLGEASFETLPADAIGRAEASRSAAKSFSDRILHAFLLQDIGATGDARLAWEKLSRERPDLPELAVLAR